MLDDDKMNALGISPNPGHSGANKSGQNYIQSAQDGSVLLNLPGELRNRIYGFILAQTSRNHRVWMARRPNRKTLKSGPVYRWNTARPYMGLTQACRLLREEFRPLYMGALRYSTSLNTLAEVIELVGLVDMKRDFGTMLDDLDQWPLPERGIDLLRFFKILQSHSEKMKVHEVVHPIEYNYDIPSYLLGFWMRMREYGTEFTSRITHLRLLSQPESRPSRATDEFEHLLQITIPPMDDTNDASQNEREADYYGWRFARSVHLEIKDCTVECYCGDARYVSQITSHRDKDKPRYYSKRRIGHEVGKIA